MEEMPWWLNSKLGQLKDGTTLRHVYKRGEYSGDEITASVKGERIFVSGDPGPRDTDFSTRTPMGAARVADRQHRGNDARNSDYDGWGWWEYQNDDGEWVPIRELPELTSP